ncbi:rod-determining factor RdfA (plasmid) [Haloarcula salina]|uniref:rod-determining factor RdfA n=1 Tax=Haloarcula salina TaxID=1429914 RepID=UPI003C6EA659
MTEDTSVELAPADPERRSKVGRVIAERGLDGMGERLERRWLGAGSEQSSLRELAEYFNRVVVRAAMEERGIQVLDGEDAHFCELLTDEEVTSGTRTQAKRRLERDGIDIDRLTDDFVSHQAIHTYLTEYRNVERTSGDTPDRLEQGRNTVQKLRNRLHAVTETTISMLSEDDLSAGDISVYVDVKVSCDECGTQTTIGDFLDSDGCDCE